MAGSQDWYNILDDVLQCCVCLEIPKSKVLQCELGHHICHFCRSKLPECPICKKNFSETRNLLAEDLISRFTDIQLSVQNAIESSKNDCLKFISKYKKQMDATVLKRQYRSVSSQTDLRTTIVDSYTQTNEKTSKNFIQNTEIRQTTDSKAYLCLIDSCTLEMSYIGLLKHLREFHESIFYEVQQKNNTFYKEFTVTIDEVPEQYNFAYRISNMGLFFFNITIHENEILTSNLHLVNNIISTNQFMYELQITNPEQRLHRLAKVTPYLRNKETAFPSVQISKKHMAPLIQLKSISFTLLIKRR